MGVTIARICVGRGIRGEVEIVRDPAEEGVAHGAADQGQLVPGRRRTRSPDARRWGRRRLHPAARGLPRRSACLHGRRSKNDRSARRTGAGQPPRRRIARMMADTDAARRSAPPIRSPRLTRLRAASIAAARWALAGRLRHSSSRPRPGVTSPRRPAGCRRRGGRRIDVTVSIATEPRARPGPGPRRHRHPHECRNDGDRARIRRRRARPATASPPAPTSTPGSTRPPRMARPEIDAAGPSVTVATPRLAPGRQHHCSRHPSRPHPSDSPDRSGACAVSRPRTPQATPRWRRAAAPSPGTPASRPRITPVAVAMTITAPVGTTGLLNADELTQLTRPGGLLTRQLDGVVGREVAVGIDPMIIASIRLLGTSAPESAVSWLEQLATLDNETFPLAWADADLAAQAQAGVTELLGPTSLDYAIDPANFSGETVAPTPTPTATTATQAPDARPSSTGSSVHSTDAATPARPPPSEPEAPTVSPTAVMPTTLPSLADLLSWPYTATNVAWPAAGSVAASDPAVFAANGLTTTIVSSSELTDAGTATPRAAAVAGAADGKVALADDRLSAALSAAVGAVTDLEWRHRDGRGGRHSRRRVSGGDARRNRAGRPRPRLAADLDATACHPRCRRATRLGCAGSPSVIAGCSSDIRHHRRRWGVSGASRGRPAAARRRGSAHGVLDSAHGSRPCSPGASGLSCSASSPIGWIPQPETWTDAIAEHRDREQSRL